MMERKDRRRSLADGVDATHARLGTSRAQVGDQVTSGRGTHQNLLVGPFGPQLPR